MRAWLPLLALVCLASKAHAGGILVNGPDPSKPTPVKLLSLAVEFTLDGPSAKVSTGQTFRNAGTEAARNVEWVFPLPTNAAVSKVVVQGKEIEPEIVAKDRAERLVGSYLEQTKNPALLDYPARPILRVKLGDIAPGAAVTIQTTYSTILAGDGGLAEFAYPLRWLRTLPEMPESFVVSGRVNSPEKLGALYSPSHAVVIDRPDPKSAVVTFRSKTPNFEQDLQLFAGTDAKGDSLHLLTHRPNGSEQGYFLLLVNPGDSNKPGSPRDLVMVLDTSGSMDAVKMDQARAALKLGLTTLTKDDNFGLMAFSANVNPFDTKLRPATPENLQLARDWIGTLKAGGGTNIALALDRGLAMKPADAKRPFTLTFFTDGLPTLGETRPDKIAERAATQAKSLTRVYTFGVGDDVNAALLDRLASKTRAASAYVRPAEDIAKKAGTLFAKIARPALLEPKLASEGVVRLGDIYPMEMPDLFHGQQEAIFGTFTGSGPADLSITGTVDGEPKTIKVRADFPKQTPEEREWIEPLWAARKVGYILEQIRVAGPSREAVAEVELLAKKYGIVTPYTSYLFASPEPPRPGGRPNFGGDDRFRQIMEGKGGELKKLRDEAVRAPAGAGGASPEVARLQRAGEALAKGDKAAFQQGKDGVELALDSRELQSRAVAAPSASRRAMGRTLWELDGRWIDADLKPDAPRVAVKAQGKAYVELLKAFPALREVLRLGNRLAVVMPNGAVLVVDPTEGADELSVEQRKMFGMK